MLLAIKKLLAVFILTFSGLVSVPHTPVVSPSLPPPHAVEAPEAVPPPVMKDAAASPAVAVNTPAEISLALLKNCLHRAGESGMCLDAIFRQYLKTHTTADALALLRGYEAADNAYRLACHPVIHALGRETFRKAGTVQDSFAECDQTCHSGCYHGAMERFLRGSSASDGEEGHISLEELRQKSATACDPNQPTRFRFQCLHGLGHALLFFSDYRLREALASCDVLPDAWSRSSCYGGLFMENVFSATPQKRDLSPTDYHYPCNAIDTKYRGDCYMMQTTRMTEMGLSTERLLGECRAAKEYQYVCMQSIGRDLSNEVRVGDPRLVAAKCELGTGAEREACTRGVAYALIDNTWDGRYAFPFCNAFRSAEDVSRCFTMSANYLQGTFEKSTDAIAAECRVHLLEPAVCVEDASGR